MNLFHYNMILKFDIIVFFLNRIKKFEIFCTKQKKLMIQEMKIHYKNISKYRMIIL